MSVQTQLQLECLLLFVPGDRIGRQREPGLAVRPMQAPHVGYTIVSQIHCYSGRVQAPRQERLVVKVNLRRRTHDASSDITYYLGTALCSPRSCIHQCRSLQTNMLVGHFNATLKTNNHQSVCSPRSMHVGGGLHLIAQEPTVITMPLGAGPCGEAVHTRKFIVTSIPLYCTTNVRSIVGFLPRRSTYA